MIRIIVRSKRDKDAVNAMLDTFYKEWGIQVYTLHGARKLDQALNELEHILSKEHYYVILLGRDDAELAMDLSKILPINTVVHIVPRAKIRNTRIEHLANEFNTAKSIFRLRISWDEYNKVYELSDRKASLENYSYNPAYDVFLLMGRSTSSLLSKIFGKSICVNPLVVRKFGGVHDIYCGLKRVGVLNIPDEGVRPSGKIFRSDDVGEFELDLNKLIDHNKSILEVHEYIAKKFLEKFLDWADTIVVPWSGGKDSTAALILALNVFGKDRVKALYSDTGTEFPWTTEYIETISSILDIDVYKVYAGVDKGLLFEGKPMPTHDNRWCTERKIASITRGLGLLSKGNTLIVVGDRDAESRRRSLRPFVRVIDDNTLIVSPIKLWSALHVQLFILSKKIPLNPLYNKGFYRIGCYICPALRSWEIYIMLNDASINLRLSKYPLFKKFIENRLKMISTHMKEIEHACDLFNVCG